MMPGYDYSKLVRVAEKLINRYGQVVEYTQVVVGDYDVSTGSTDNTSDTVSVYAVILDYGKYQTTKNDASVLVGDRQAFIAGSFLEFSPAIGDIVSFSEGDYKVVSLPMLLNPGGTILLYELHLRK